jgi:nucleoside-diphosphate-sugar epimerase
MNDDNLPDAAATARRCWVLTGASSYLGQRVTRRLLERGDRVLALLRDKAGRMRAQDLPASVEAVTLPPGDVDLAEMLRSTLAGAGSAGRLTGVIHLAAVADFNHETGPGIATLLDTNVRFACLVVDAAARLGASVFVNTGSFAQNAEGDAAYAPNSLYAASKQALEVILEHFRRRYDLRIATLRLYDVYGPADPRPKLLNLLAALDLDSGEDSLPVTEGAQEMDPVHVDDAADAYLACADWLCSQPEATAAVFGIRGGHARTVREIIELAERVFGRSLPVSWGARPYRREEIFHLWRAPAPPFWRPRISLEQGLAELVEARAGRDTCA